MDLATDIWGQLAVEAAQVYLPDGTVVNPFANTVCYCNYLFTSSPYVVI